MIEYLRLWELLSLARGIALLTVGAYYYEAKDWDVPISLIMATLTYLTAPWTMRVILELCSGQRYPSASQFGIVNSKMLNIASS